MKIQDCIIEAPMFDLHTEEGVLKISEYTLRNIMLHVAMGELNHEQVVIMQTLEDGSSERIRIRKDGIVENEVIGLSINSDLTLKMFQWQNMHS